MACSAPRVGVLFAFLVTQSLGDLGLGFALPLGQLVVFMVLAVVVGVVAAVRPRGGVRGYRCSTRCGPSSGCSVQILGTPA